MEFFTIDVNDFLDWCLTKELLRRFCIGLIIIFNMGAIGTKLENCVSTLHLLLSTYLWLNHSMVRYLIVTKFLLYNHICFAMVFLYKLYNHICFALVLNIVFMFGNDSVLFGNE